MLVPNIILQNPKECTSKIKYIWDTFNSSQNLSFRTAKIILR